MSRIKNALFIRFLLLFSHTFDRLIIGGDSMPNRIEPVEGYKLVICKKIDEYLKKKAVE